MKECEIVKVGDIVVSDHDVYRGAKGVVVIPLGGYGWSPHTCGVAFPYSAPLSLIDKEVNGRPCGIMEFHLGYLKWPSPLEQLVSLLDDKRDEV